MHGSMNIKYILQLDTKCAVLFDFAILNVYTMSRYPWIGGEQFLQDKRRQGRYTG
jgi:hypothetical protein